MRQHWAHMAAVAVFALTFASWPGGPVAHARIVAHGAPLGEQPATIAGAVDAFPNDELAETFDVHVVNTQEDVRVRVIGKDARPDDASMAALVHALRSFPDDKEGPIDPALVEVLHQIAKATGQRVEVVSACRRPRHRWDHNYHVRGQAADVRVPGVPTWKLVRLVKKLGVKGVGNYPTSAFVPVDTRDVPYTWTDWSGPGKAGK